MGVCDEMTRQNALPRHADGCSQIGLFQIAAGTAGCLLEPDIVGRCHGIWRHWQPRHIHGAFFARRTHWLAWAWAF
jgi:hypothetical protein